MRLWVVREGFLEEVTSKLNFKGKGNHRAEEHLCNSMMCMGACVATTSPLWPEQGRQGVEGER